MLTALGAIEGAGSELRGSAAVSELQLSLNSLSDVTGGGGVSVTGEVTPATVAAVASILGELGLPDSIRETLELVLPWAQMKPDLMAHAKNLVEQYAPTLAPLVIDLVGRLRGGGAEPDPTVPTEPFDPRRIGLDILPHYKPPAAAIPEPLVIVEGLHDKSFFRIDNVWMWGSIAALAIGGAFTYRFVKG